MPMGRGRVECLVVVPPHKPPAEYDERKGQKELDEKPHGVAVDFVPFYRRLTLSFSRCFVCVDARNGI